MHHSVFELRRFLGGLDCYFACLNGDGEHSCFLAFAVCFCFALGFFLGEEGFTRCDLLEGCLEGFVAWVEGEASCCGVFGFGELVES